jgi:glutamyl-tRNA synthetase
MISNFFKKIKNMLNVQTSASTEVHSTPKITSEKKEVVVRIPPSPTGTLHVGTARTALFNFLFAKKYGGKVILRMEDTDTERSKREYEQNIIDGLKWLGITWDNPTLYRQSERVDIYKTYLEKMIANGTAFISQETAEEGKRGEVIRFKNPNKTVIFSDVVRGEISFDTTELGDFVIAKSLEEPLYHLAVVIDDFDMRVTHVIRGEDHISNTPRQILLQEAIGAPRPIYAHLPLLLGEDRSKLSKRHGAKSVNQFKDEGFTPEAIRNYLAFLGWNPGTAQEFFTLDELIQAFSLEQVQKGGAVFSEAKLRWFNREYLKQLPEAELLNAVHARLSTQGASIERSKALLPIIIDRIEVLTDIDTLISDGELAFFFNAPEYETRSLLWKKSKDLQEMKLHLEKIQELIKETDPFSIEEIKSAVWDYATAAGRGNVLWPFRYALSGREKSPDPFEIAEILGKEETLARIDTAVARINNEASHIEA